MRAKLKAAVRSELPSVQTPTSLEAEAVQQTRKAVKNSNNLWGLAFGLSFLPMTCAFDSNGLKFLLARDVPALALLFSTFGLFAWLLLVRNKSRLRLAGLGAPQGSVIPLVLASIAISAPLSMTMSQWVGPWMLLVQVAVAAATYFVWRA